ncbi:hypothetical protein COEREDRAFT_88622 [Coemansia reversa NRRL 1564]|uniref:Uncharacterized protein n=1 Tax=Coemansia reversa (strain ATCC 12441 / NRRL 1564) TaxID=763665 RepID=A0A2G5B692_COERN|nr:hypothetical protein COEREDRAFT_88622 [Coemansia reversa NRRL 1564]|eukprot:PIA14525.1 hypothetical protein COEREDRAFT_88622 [Coemansia reversa NRRL 1564]
MVDETPVITAALMFNTNGSSYVEAFAGIKSYGDIKNHLEERTNIGDLKVYGRDKHRVIGVTPANGSEESDCGNYILVGYHDMQDNSFPNEKNKNFVLWRLFLFFEHCVSTDKNYTHVSSKLNDFCDEANGEISEKDTAISKNEDDKNDEWIKVKDPIKEKPVLVDESDFSEDTCTQIRKHINTVIQNNMNSDSFLFEWNQRKYKFEKMDELRSLLEKYKNN